MNFEFNITSLGQSGLLINYLKKKILVDPYLSNSVEELDSSTIKRLIKIPFKPEDLKNINLVLITHHHLDHCDPMTIPKIYENNPNAFFAGPMPVIKLLKKWGVKNENIISIKDLPFKLDPNLLISSIPAAHPKLTKSIDGTPEAVGWILRNKNKVIYIAGDTSVHQDVLNELKKFNVIDLAYLPVNEDNFFRRKAGIIGNMSIREAFQLAEETNIKTVIPVHWDMFKVNSVTPDEIKSVYSFYKWNFEMLLTNYINI